MKTGWTLSALGCAALTLTIPACFSEHDTRFFGPSQGGGGGQAPEAGAAGENVGGEAGSGVGGMAGSAAGGMAGTDPGPTDPEVCYPGPSGDYSSCVALVPWSSSWGSEYGYPQHDSPQYTAPLRFVDLSTADPGLAIESNFVLDEVMQQWKGRYGVFQPHVVEKLQAIRDQTGGPLHITSGYRSPAYNASVGGVTYSRHMYGDAADIWSDTASLSQLGNICDGLGAGYVGLYETFVHCDWRNDPLDPAFFDASFPTGYPARAELPLHTARLERATEGRSWRAPATGFDEGEPLRIWTAFDADGQCIDEATARSYEPPAAAARLHVAVGGQLELEAEL